MPNFNPNYKHMSANKWYALKVKGGREKEIKDAIEKAILKENLTTYFDQVILPYEKVHTKKKGKKVIKKRYLAYAFISIDLEGSKKNKKRKERKEIKEVLSDIKGIYGFVGLHGWGDKQEPIPIDPEEISYMLGKAQEIDNVQENINKTYAQGEVVKIIDGPLQGTIGTIKKIAQEKRKLIVVIKIFKSLTEVELSYTQVKKTD